MSSRVPRILVAVHASDSSRAALERARALASATGRSLRVVSVTPISASGVEALAWGGGARGIPLPMPQEGQIELLWGNPLDIVLAEAADPGVELLVVGEGRRRRLALGPLAPFHERLLRRCETPLLVVNPDPARGEGWYGSNPALRRSSGRPALVPVAGGGEGGGTASRPSLRVVR